MVDLVPIPFRRLVTRAFEELRRRGSIYDLPASKFYLGSPDHDLGVRFHGHRASSPLGPAAGPHSQLAQNIVLAWLGGSRIVELKTVQILDTLEIPRPCIDMRNVGYNVEWSQELRLAQSLDEYVKAAMLIEMLTAELDLEPGFADVIYDMSVGYDLAGIQSEPVQAFLAGMMDATPIVERLRGEIPDEYARFRDLPFRTRLSDTLTLSTFHGCPPDEIEKIIDYLLRHNGLHCVIKLNPTLLGEAEVHRLLVEEMGYETMRVPGSAFAKDTTWDQAKGFVARLRTTAAGLGQGLGVKFSNTLIVEHDGEFLPATEEVKYLSGPPLHVLATHLVGRFREEFGAAVPVSFSAGIERRNFPRAVALGLVPITVCTDLLKPGGYARQRTYLQALTAAMDAVGARTIEDFIVATAGGGVDAATAVLRNTKAYVAELAADPSYAAGANSKMPKKLGSMLELFDCVTCDKCVPVCPNDANFTMTIEPREIPVQTLREVGGRWEAAAAEPLRLTKKHQIANFADFCNECGNCDIFCPEDGGPYVLKPRFFGSREEWERWTERDGFFLAADGDVQRVLGRFEGAAFEAEFGGARARYQGSGFDVTFDPTDLVGSITGMATDAVDMRWFHVMDVVRESVFASGDVHWVNVP